MQSCAKKLGDEDEHWSSGLLGICCHRFFSFFFFFPVRSVCPLELFLSCSHIFVDYEHLVEILAASLFSAGKDLKEYARSPLQPP